MRTGAYFVLLFLSAVCAGLTVALVVVAHANQRLQLQLQARQQALSQGILGPQAQQISGGVLQDMAGAAAGNVEIHRLLERYGYRLPPPRAPAPTMDLSAASPKEPTNSVVAKP